MNHHESNLLRSKNNHVLIQSLLICGGDETLLTLCPILGSSCRKPLPKRRWQLWSQRGCPPQWLGLRHHWFLVLDNRLKGPPVLVSGASGSACWSSCEAKQRSWLCRDHVLHPPYLLYLLLLLDSLPILQVLPLLREARCTWGRAQRAPCCCHLDPFGCLEWGGHQSSSTIVSILMR